VDFPSLYILYIHDFSSFFQTFDITMFFFCFACSCSRLPAIYMHKIYFHRKKKHSTALKRMMLLIESRRKPSRRSFVCCSSLKPVQNRNSFPYFLITLKTTTTPRYSLPKDYRKSFGGKPKNFSIKKTQSLVAHMHKPNEKFEK
jgi:hypothetical protein